MGLKLCKNLVLRLVTSLGQNLLVLIKKKEKKAVYCSKGKDSLFETIETIEAIQRIPYNRPDRLKGFWDGDWDDPEVPDD